MSKFRYIHKESAPISTDDMIMMEIAYQLRRIGDALEKRNNGGEI